MSAQISRRDFIRIGGLSLAGLAFSPYFPPDQVQYEPNLIGRVTADTINVYDQPDWNSRTVAFRKRDELLNLYYPVTSESGPAYNPIWYRIWGGYVHSAFIQSVSIKINSPLDTLSQGSRLAELTVPYTQPFDYSISRGWTPHAEFRLYFGSTHWIDDLVEGPDGTPWYRIEDELYDNFFYYAPAGHLRPIPYEELTPLSPDIPPGDKRVEVSLSNQSLQAYERDRLVMDTLISSGVNSSSTTNGYPTSTPLGRHNIYSKMPSKHMGASDLAGTPDGDRALPGVPWTSFFAEGGYAIHGTYWHNNFGVQMSRGCINMRNHEAKWLFRWFSPQSEPDAVETRGYGTQIIITA